MKFDAGRFLKAVVVVEDAEVEQLMHGLGSYFCCMAGFFLLQPLRDDTAVALGSKVLPLLFLVSLAATVAIVPSATAHIVSFTANRSGRAVRQVYQGMALATAAFYVMFMLEAGVAAPGLTGATPAASRVKTCVHAAFYVWVTLQNVLATSIMWSRLADVFGPEAGARLFGVIGAGATAGQLVGSLCAGLISSVASMYSAQSSAVTMPQLLLCAAVMMLQAGKHAARLKPPVGRKEGHVSADDGDDGKAPDKPKPSITASLQLIWRSSYLLHICAYLFANAVCSSMFYFVKTITMLHSDVDTSSRRTAWFAGVNSVSAGIMLVLQVTASGRALKGLGIPAALAATASVNALFFAAAAVHPSVRTVAVSDVVRRMVTYVATRPAREVLFTVVSRDEKYQAKAIVDTVVVRVGDTVAAALFRWLDTHGDVEPGGAAAVASGIATSTALIAVALGMRQQRMAKQMALDVFVAGA